MKCPFLKKVTEKRSIHKDNTHNPPVESYERTESFANCEDQYCMAYLNGQCLKLVNPSLNDN